MSIVIIADDLSGAAELAGIAFAHGLTAEVQRQFDPASTADVIAVDTDTRGLAAEEAAAQVAAVASAVVASKPAWIFKKTDSVLRGHPAAEITAVLSAAGFARALFVPANPSRGRTIFGGVYSIGGVPLDQTAFAFDPEFPRGSAQVAELLGSAAAISVPDVLDVVGVRELARSLDAATLPAGAADFFTAVLTERTGRQQAAHQAQVTLSPPLLLICGSRASWPQRRAAAIAASIPVVCLDDSPAAESPNAHRALQIGIRESTPDGTTPAKLLTRLTQLAASVIQSTQFGTILVEGGATAAALAEQMGWTRFRVVATAPAGVGVLLPLTAAAPPVLIKPGSYDWPPEIWLQFLAADG